MKIITFAAFTLTVSILAAAPLVCVGAVPNNALFARVDERSNVLVQSFSSDGELTWSN